MSPSRDRLDLLGEQPGEIMLQSPPMLPKSGSGGLVQLMMFLPMMLGMGAMSFVYIGRDGGVMTWIFGALFVTAMGGMVVMSLGRGGMAKKAQINEERRDYQRYLAGLRTKVRAVADEQRAALIAQQPDPADLWAYVETGQYWDRRRGDRHFALVRAATGPQPLATPLRAPQTVPLEDLDPVSSTNLKYFIRTYSTVEGLPVSLSLRSYAAATLSGRRPDVLGMTRSLLAQLVTFHSPTDLRVAFCVAPDRRHDWDWAKWLPHATAPALTDATGRRRLVASGPVELADLLGPDLGDRPAFTRRPGTAQDLPHVVVVVDGGGTQGEPRLLAEEGRLGITVLEVGGDQPRAASNEQLLSLHVAPDQLGMVVLDGGAEVRLGFLGTPDQLDRGAAEALARTLTPLYQGTAVVSEKPMSATFGLAGLLGIGDPRDTDTTVTWAPRAARDRLRIPLGVNPEGRPVELDFKESAEGGMGPHGLVIGATGSGKSELLRTLVTALAVTHSSEKLNLALIDFKGGATFAGMTGLPHVCAVITNLSDDLALVDRMADALNGELLRRQELLHAAGNYASVRDYEKARADGVPLQPLPSLLVIIDEFSELLSSRPEFIDLFVAIGRLGRSLGIHLLLASQRLEEGRLRGLDSHLSYRIGLRTFSASESRAVLGVADAYHLPPVPGSAYLKSDNDTLTRFKAAYVSGELPPRSTIVREDGQQVGVLPFTLDAVEVPLAAPVPVAETVETGTGETIIGAMLSRLEGRGPDAHQIWLPPLAEPPTLDQLLPPLGDDPSRGLCPLGWGGNGKLTIPVALVDKPFEQRRDMLWADFSGAAGNALVVGAPQSGKSTLLKDIAAMLALTHTPSEVQLFVLDMGGGALAPIAGLPHVSGYATRRDAQRCRRVVAELTTLLEQREEFFAAQGLESMAAFRARRADLVESTDGREFGDVFLFVDNWTTIRQEYEQLEEQITGLAARGLGFGIHVIVTVNQWIGVRAQLRDAIGTRFELRLGDPADSSIDRKVALNVPADRPGRGLTGEKLHFLAALPRVDGDQRPETIGAGGLDLVRRITAAWPGSRAPQVRLLPSEVPLESLPSSSRVVLGIAESTLRPVELDFAADPHFLAFGDVESGKSSLLRALATGISAAFSPDEALLLVGDYRRGLLGAVDQPHLLGYAGAENTLTDLVGQCATAMRNRLPGPDVTPEQLRSRSWWRGPDLYVLIDDYELVATAGKNPLLPLLEFLPQARDIGLHLIIARASGGAGRGLYEPVLQRVRELGSPGLIMSGTKEEGPLLGDVKPSPQPPGRGTLVSRRHGTGLVQVAWTKPAES